MSIFSKIIFLLFFLISVQCCIAQTVPSRNTDTLRTIEIIRARSQRQITINDTTVLQTLAGDAMVRQGGTLLMGDSIVLNQRTGVAEVFGNVHINDGDTMHTYAQYLQYVGNERIAYLKRNVKLTDGKAIMTTEDLVYNIATGIANYTNGGKVINDKTVLTSQDGSYYSDTKDAVFRNNVHLIDPKYNMTADSLRYNTEFKTAYFISPTHIVSKNGIIDTRSGSYNLETGNAIFDSRSSYKDSTSSITGDKIAFEEKTGIIQIEGRGKYVDSVNNVIVLGDQLLVDKKNQTFLATRKPVMIFFRDNDSTYVAADTLFSGLRRYDSTGNNFIQVVDTLKRDSTITINDSTEIKTTLPPDSSSFESRLESITKDRSGQPEKMNPDSTVTHPEKTDPDKLANNRNDSLALPEKENPSLTTTAITTTDTISKPTVVNLDKISKDSVRYFLGFHHVRIYNDSLQAVSDSMYYSTEDSTFKLFGNPVFWNDQTQVKGDTMYMYTENQKAKRLYVYYNAIVVNRTKEGFFNQMGGRTINGFFKDGTVDYIRVKGSPAESVFYPQDEDSAYVGMNRSKGDVIDIYFLKKELNKIKFINDVDGTLYPLKQVPEDQRFLKNFIWEDKRRPKNKLELFE